MKVKILFNSKKGWARGIAREVKRWLKEEGQTIVERREEICFVVGGDGTIFYYKDEIDGAVFGIGGPWSKLCHANRRNWKNVLCASRGKFIKEARVALSASINGKLAGWAINDVVVHSRTHNFIDLAVRAGDKKMEFGGDGVIIATPMGSTGYAYSAGGNKMKTCAKKVGIVPICPYLRIVKPHAVWAGQKISIRAVGAADLVLDGQKIIKLKTGERVDVVGNRKIYFVKTQR